MQPLGDGRNSDSPAQSLGAGDVAAVVCTINSISGIRDFLISLRQSGVKEIVVLDASSTDGTKDVALELADWAVGDPGTGLVRARNTGIEKTNRLLILNSESDNVMLSGELQKLIDYLVVNDFHGVSAQTVIKRDDWISRGVNTWRQGRFPAGEVSIIGTPTPFFSVISCALTPTTQLACSQMTQSCVSAGAQNLRRGLGLATQSRTGVTKPVGMKSKSVAACTGGLVRKATRMGARAAELFHKACNH